MILLSDEDLVDKGYGVPCELSGLDESESVNGWNNSIVTGNVEGSEPPVHPLGLHGFKILLQCAELCTHYNYRI